MICGKHRNVYLTILRAAYRAGLVSLEAAVRCLAQFDAENGVEPEWVTAMRGAMRR